MSQVPRLVGLPGGLAEPAPQPVLVCGHCGDRTSPGPAGLVPSARVCGRCGLGLLFTVGAGIAPLPRDPFLLVDRALLVSATSRAAEQLFGVREVDVVGRHLSDVLVPADIGVSPQALAVRVVAAVEGARAEDQLVVRPPGEFGVRWWLRIGPCGPPTAALLVLAAA